MEITIKFSHHLGVAYGIDDGVAWQRVQFFGDTLDDLEGTVCFTAIGGDKVRQVLELCQGDEILVTFYQDCREFLGVIYSDLRVVSIAVVRSVLGSERGGVE